MAVELVGASRRRSGMRSGTSGHLVGIGAAVVTAALALSGCGQGSTVQSGGSAASGSGSASSKAPSPSEGSTTSGGLAGKEYVSTGRTKDGKPYPLVPGSTVHLTFKDGRVVANAGCNTMSGAAGVKDGKLVLLGPTTSTMMGCEKALMDQDAWLGQLLESSPTVAVQGSTLTLTAGGTVLTLTDAVVAQPALPLTGTLWNLNSISTGDSATPGTTVSSVPAGVTSTMRIVGGTMQVQAGCNTGSGTVAVTDTTMEIGPIALTRKMCPQDAMTVEHAVTSVLQGTVKYSIKSSALTVTGTGGTLTYQVKRGA